MKTLLALPLLSLSCLFLAGCGGVREPASADPVRPVKLLKLELADSAGVIEFPAMVRARASVELSFNVPGRVIELPVLEGVPIAAGELIARLDDADFRSRLEAAEAAKELAQVEFRRFEELAASGAVAVAELDRKRAALQAAVSDLELVSKQVADTVLTAPFDGLVARRMVHRFSNVQPKEPVVLFQAMAPLDIVVDVPEPIILRSANRGNRSPRAHIRFENLPGIRIPVSLYEIGTEVDPQTRTYPVVFTLDRVDGLTVLPGMSAILGADLGEAEEGGLPRFLLPPLAVVANPDGSQSVWVRDPTTGEVAQRRVQVGSLHDGGIEIIGGLAVGDEVVVAGISRLKPGLRVRPFQP